MSAVRRALLGATVAALTIAPTLARAGSPHFVNNAFTEYCDDTGLTVTGKEAGLGDEEQIHVVLNATCECINPGSKHPKAANKEDVSAAGDFPVQNGKADFSLTAVNTISPQCSPPMTIVWTNVSVTDSTNDLTKSLPNCTPQ